MDQIIHNLGLAMMIQKFLSLKSLKEATAVLISTLNRFYIGLMMFLCDNWMIHKVWISIKNEPKSKKSFRFLISKEMSRNWCNFEFDS